MNGLIIRSPWIEKILSGEKTWEIRGSNTKIRGTIALIKSGTGKVYGTAELVDSKQITQTELNENVGKTGLLPHTFTGYLCNYAWVLRNPVIYKQPIPYKHPQGAVIWVNLNELSEVLYMVKGGDQCES